LSIWSQAEVGGLVVEKIRELFAQHSQWLSVHLRCQMYGYERLLRALAETFHMRVC
jgi:hypothetical protein